MPLSNDWCLITGDVHIQSWTGRVVRATCAKDKCLPCQLVQTYLHSPLLSQAKQGAKLLSMQLIIFKALSVSDPHSGPVVGHPYSEEGRLEDREDVNLFMICLFLLPYISNGKEIMLWVMKKSRCKYLCPFTKVSVLENPVVFPFYDVSRCFKENSDFFLPFIPLRLIKQ